MNCDQARPLIDLYADGELDLARSLELEQHAATCVECAAALEESRKLSHAVQTSGVYRQAPAGLHARVRAAVLEDVKVREVPVLRPMTGRPVHIAWWRPVMIGLAAALTLAVFAWWWLPYGARPGEQNPLLAQEILDSHVRSLMGDHLYDVPSTDQHTVKPWFDGKVDFAPSVMNLDSDGFQLAGGRADYINGRPVAAIVYRRRKHVVNLFEWPESATAPLSAVYRNGYNMLRWKEAGMEYWAVSDLNVQELREFVALLRSKQSNPAP